MGVSWMGWRRPAVPHGQQRRGYIAVELLSEVVMWWLVVKLSRCRATKNWVCGGLDCF